MNDSALSLREIERRIDLNKKSGWGLERGTPSQLNLLSLYCQKHRLLPGDDVTLYEGRPWITIDGRVKLMRRNKDYRGFTLRPLKPEEKKDWSYDSDDIVIEALVYVDGYPQPIPGHGRVSKGERTGQGAGRLNPIAKTHPVELANKRAIARAERLAFGTESFVDDEELDDAVQTVIEEQNDPVIQAERSATYQRIYDAEPEMVTSAKSREAGRWAEIVVEANRLDVKYDDLAYELPIALDELKRKAGILKARIQAKKEFLANPPSPEVEAALL